MDVHVQSAITEGLRDRGVDVLTVYEDGMSELADPALLERATQLGRISFTRDADFLAGGAEWQRSGKHFAGILYAHQLRIGIGTCLDDLELVAKVYEPADVENLVQDLPL